jgi:tyrosine-protein phosphatase YwqE
MFSIFKIKRSTEVNFSQLVTDMHSHLLPGVDDGAPDVMMSAELIKGLLDLGYKKLITTPHVMADIYPNTPFTIEAAYESIKKESQVSQINFPLQTAAEYLLDEQLDKMLKQGDPLLCISGKMVLIEFSFVAPPADYKEKIFQLQMHGYLPVLAHPERYLYWGGRRLVFDDLKTAGCLFAVNLLSFTGYYGKPCVDISNYFLKKNYIDFLGTDLHHPRHLDALRSAHQLMPVINQLLDKGSLMNPRL